MADRPIKVPGPDHPITIEKNLHRVVVKLGGQVLADTRNTLTLREAKYPAVQYIPRADVDMAKLIRTEHMTYCPFMAIVPITACLTATSGRSMRCGPTRHHSPRSRPSGTMSPSIQTASRLPKPKPCDVVPSTRPQPIDETTFRHGAVSSQLLQRASTCFRLENRKIV
jgi:Domain of unknown function (DUF427)